MISILIQLVHDHSVKQRGVAISLSSVSPKDNACDHEVEFAEMIATVIKKMQDAKEGQFVCIIDEDTLDRFRELIKKYGKEFGITKFLDFETEEVTEATTLQKEDPYPEDDLPLPQQKKQLH